MSCEIDLAAWPKDKEDTVKGQSQELLIVLVNLTHDPLNLYKILVQKLEPFVACNPNFLVSVLQSH